jgi:8-oxo-dGTP diphosphatase
MQRVAICLPIDEKKRWVLLGLKRRGFGQGKLVGLGGKIEAGESLAAAAVRELREEAGLHTEAGLLEHVAHLTFLFPGHPAWDHQMDVFLVRVWEGEPLACEEIEPQWRPIDALPFDRMWDDGRYWLPQALAGQALAATFIYGEDLATVVDVVSEHRLEQISNHRSGALQPAEKALTL